MRPIAAWFARNPVASNLLMLTIIVGGLFSAASIKIEMFPQFSLDSVSIQVPYPGAVPEEIEESVCVPIEEEIQDLEGIKKISSTAVEGLGSVRVEIQTGYDVRRLLDDVKTRVDALDTLPEEAEKPIISEATMRTQVINLAIFGDADEAVLKRLGERARDELSERDGISQVDLASVRPYEVSIEVSEPALRRWGLSFDDVARAVRASSVDVSGGTVKTRGGEILLRTKGRAYYGPDFERIVLRTRPDGSRLYLSDVADVVDGFEDTDQSTRFNGKPGVTVTVYRVGDESALEVASIVEDYVRELRSELPAGVEVVTWGDASRMLRSRLDLLIKNGRQGLVLVFLILALFLRMRLSFWVTLGIPISFLGALLVMPSLGGSVNMLSMFAFILVLGIIVDDAIVVGENIHTESGGVASVAASTRGVLGVSVPVTFAVLTTVVAFLPMIGLPGILGKFFAVIPMTVIPALLFSLIESQWILPSHLAHATRLDGWLTRFPPFSWWARFQSGFVRGVEFTRLVLYRRLLGIAVEWRYTTIALGLATLLLAVGLVGGGFLKFVFFPEVEGDIVSVALTMPEGTSASVTGDAVGRIEQAALRLRDELREEAGQDVVQNMMASVGEQPYESQKRRFNGDAGIVGPQYGEVMMELLPAETRTVTAAQIAARWRELAGPVPGAVDLRYDVSIMSAGDPISVQFAGADVDQLKAAADELEHELEGFAGVYDVGDSFRGGKRELALDIRPEAEAAGLTRLDLARQVRQGFYGEEAQRIQRGRDEVKVMVRYPRSDRRTLFGLEQMRVRLPGGREVPFSTVAEVHSQRGYATIQRTDRHRTVLVTANVDNTVANANEIMAEVQARVLPEILDRHRGVTYSLEGQSNDQAETGRALAKTFVLALLAIFGLMAIPFRSYLQPLIVMTAIPFGIVGAVFGHAIMGMDLSMLSVLGLVALTGVVVNDSLVMVDFVNREREAGRDVHTAALEAGVARFRPILLTSLTTFAGLLPLMLEKSVQAQFLIPMAVSLSFGVLFATFITLFLVPSAYVVLEDLAHAVRWLYGRETRAARA